MSRPVDLSGASLMGGEQSLLWPSVYCLAMEPTQPVSLRGSARRRDGVNSTLGVWICRPEAVLAVMVAAYYIVFAFLVYRQQSNFGTYGFDIGIHDQGIWLISHGDGSFVTVRGLNYFAHHVNIISLAFVPFYWLGAGPHLLILVHTAVVAAGAIPLWLITRDRCDDPWVSLVVPIAYLCYPAVQWITWWAYHPDSMSMLPLLFAWWLASRRRWGWYAVAVVVALACKEDDALAALALGLVVAFWRLPPKGERRRVRLAAATTAAVGIVWYTICTRVIIPSQQGGRAPFYLSFFPALGSSIPAIIFNSIFHPSRWWHLMSLPDRRTYYVQMFGPVAFLPVLALGALLVGAPQFGVDVTAQTVQGATIKSQYASLVTVGIFVATAEAFGVIYRRRPQLLRAFAGLLVFATAGSTVAWGLSPISTQFHTGVWVAHNSNASELQHILDLAGPTVGVSVSYFLTPHVTHRQTAYEFPNPWISVNYGVYGLNPPQRGEPARVQWILLAKSTLDAGSNELLGQLTAPGAPFAIVYDVDGIIAAKRMRTGS